MGRVLPVANAGTGDGAAVRVVAHSQGVLARVIAQLHYFERPGAGATDIIVGVVVASDERVMAGILADKRTDRGLGGDCDVAHSSCEED